MLGWIEVPLRVSDSMNPHAFIVMPFGVKEGIDFDAVFRDLIVPALNDAGFTPFRADQEMRAGEIRFDMFQELLLSDLVVADLSIDNPNVWYEVGIRHALRRSNTVLIYNNRRDRQPFDLYTDRRLRYTVDTAGAPDATTREADRRRLAEFARATFASHAGRDTSPPYYYLQYLREPQWRELLMDDPRNESASRFHDWLRRIETAQRAQLPGDIAALAPEAPVQALAVEARVQAAKALRAGLQYAFALEQVDAALELEPDNICALQLKAGLLGRMGRRFEAETLIDNIIERHDDGETWALRGRLEKEWWVDEWIRTGTAGTDPAQSIAARRTAAVDADARLDGAIDAYRAAMLRDPGNAYPAINAYTLARIRHDLEGDRNDDSVSVSDLESAVRWTLLTARLKLEPHEKNYWIEASAAELTVCTGTPEQARRAWKTACTAARANRFALDSSRQQMALLAQLGVCAENASAAMAVIDAELDRCDPPSDAPAKVFLFSGHMIDQPGRPARFPAEKTPLAASAIAQRLEQLGAGPGDLALCGGACGGDLLFAEAAMARGVRVEMHLPKPEPVFIKESVLFAGDEWRDRYLRIRDSAGTAVRIAPEALGDVPAGMNAHERNNRWLLSTALCWGNAKLRFICLWNGETGHGDGGTKHMYDIARDRTVHVYWIDTRKLFSGETQ